MFIECNIYHNAIYISLTKSERCLDMCVDFYDHSRFISISSNFEKFWGKIKREETPRPLGQCEDLLSKRMKSHGQLRGKEACTLPFCRQHLHFNNLHFQSLQVHSFHLIKTTVTLKCPPKKTLITTRPWASRLMPPTKPSVKLTLRNRYGIPLAFFLPCFLCRHIFSIAQMAPRP